MIQSVRNTWFLIKYTHWLLMSGYFTLQEVGELSYYAGEELKRR